MIGIYARQSVEKKDSISIEYQIARCKAMYVENESCQVFQDQGFSGKNMQRPGFQAMLQAITSDKLSRVIVYKLDRISRSLQDFLQMMQLFRQHEVTLISCCEAFDTTTELGNMMLNMLMMFAEMEQKTIAARVRDNYYARGAQQRYLGGTAPYGFEKVQQGVNAHLERHLTESAVVLWMYQMYGVEGKSIGQLVRELNQDGIRTKTGKLWSHSGVARILHNPVYVQADAAVYRYLCRQQAVLPQSSNAYTNGTGCQVYGDPHRRIGSKFTRLEGEYVMPCKHNGYVPSSLWLTVQERMTTRAGCSNRGSGSMTWLQGVLVCNQCKTRLYGKRNGAGTIYLTCRGKRQGICDGISALHAREIEDAILPSLLYHLKRIVVDGQQKALPLQQAEELDEIEQSIRQLTETMTTADPALHPYLLEELGTLHQRRQIVEDKYQQNKVTNVSTAFPVQKYWQNANSAEKKRLAQLVIEKILVGTDTLDVYYK